MTPTSDPSSAVSTDSAPPSPSPAEEARHAEGTAEPVALRSSRRWAGRLGIAAFLFFLAKGLLWLAVPVLVAHGFFGCEAEKIPPALLTVPLQISKP